MKRKIEFNAKFDDLGEEKVKIVVFLDNKQQDFYCNITESTNKRIDWYKDKIVEMLRGKFHISQIKIK